MSAKTYSSPPTSPELDSSSPFYPTLQCLAIFASGSGMARDLVHNFVPRRYAGPYGKNFGEDPRWTTGFPHSPANASLRFSGGSRALAYPYSGWSDAGHSGPDFTIFGVFLAEDILPYNGGLAMIASSVISPYGNNGSPLESITQLANGVCLAATAPNTLGGPVVLGFTEQNGFGEAIFPCNEAVVQQGHWYAFSVSWSQSLNGASNPRRIHLHDLGTDTRICGTTTDHLTWSNLYWPYGPYTDLGWGNSGKQPFRDLVVNPGGPSQFGPFIGKIHLIGADSQFWDSTGRYVVAQPSGFTGTSPFDVFVNNIYGMAGSTYASGGTTILINTGNANQVATGGMNVGNPISYPGLAMLAGTITANTAPAGTPTGLGVVAMGDCAVTRITETAIDITVSRPQGAAAAITSYTLHCSGTAPFTPGSGNAVATHAGNSFTYSPLDGAIRYFIVTGTDGTTTYTFPQVQAARRPFPAQFMVTVGNSYGTITGGDPTPKIARAGASLGFDTSILALDFDGASMGQWISSTNPGDAPYPPYGASQNPLSFAAQVIARETAARGKPVDLALCWLIENNVGFDPTAYNAAMTTLAAALNTAGAIRFSPMPFGDRETVRRGGLGEGIGENLASLDNGTTIFYLGKQWLEHTSNFAWDFSGGHPSIVIAHDEAIMLMQQYLSRVVNPSSGAVLAPGSIFKATIIIDGGPQ